MFIWDKQKVIWYDEALKESNFPEVVMELLSSYINNNSTVMDVGCGPGTLAVPLAKKVKHVLAVDSSTQMLACLEAKCDDISNITLSNEDFDSFDENSKYDILLSSNVIGLWKDNPDALKKTKTLADQVFLILPAGANRDKFYFNEIYPILYDKEFPARDDYKKVYDQICGFLKISPEVILFDYRFDQTFVDIDEAVMFWRSYLDIEPGVYDDKLRSFLKKKLKKRGEKLLAEFPKKAALIRWSTK